MDSAAAVDRTGQTLTAAHGDLVRDTRFQFDRIVLKPPETPEWLRWLGDAVEAVAPLLKWAFWIGVAALAGLILYALGRELLRLRLGAAKPKVEQAAVEPEWRPQAAAARDLLEAADRLAAEGRYADAVHLILLHSLEDIERRRPRALRPALTTREIATLSVLPAAARPAFAKIGQVVEKSLFGGDDVDAAEFAACRRDYEAFALPAGWTA